MTTTVLVTGATGFVGSHVLEALALRPDVRAIAAARDSTRLHSAHGDEVRVGDFRDPGHARSVVEGVDVICLCHAWTCRRSATP